MTPSRPGSDGGTSSTGRIVPLRDLQEQAVIRLRLVTVVRELKDI
jgi:hypothetical protein